MCGTVLREHINKRRRKNQAVALGQVSSKVCVVKYVQYSVEDDFFVGCISCVVKYSKSSS